MKIIFNKKIYVFLLSLAFLFTGVLTLSLKGKAEITIATTWLTSSNTYETNFRDEKGEKVTNSNSLDTHYISTPQELAGFAYLISISDDRSYINDAFYLLNNIDLTGYDWVPIGTENRPFSGSFDGNGKVISGLKITNSQSYAGLFGCIELCSIENIMVSGNINFVDEVDDRCENIGGVVGLARTYTTFTKISCSVSIYTPNSNNVGGLVGRCSENIKISKCFVNPGTTIEGRSFVGGLVGRKNDSIGVVDISDIYNNGNEVSGDFCVGGIVGYIRNTSTIKKSFIKNGYNNATINADDVAGILGSNAGGIIGSGTNISLESLYNYGSISGRYAGGIAGELINSKFSDDNVTTISNVTNIGVVSGRVGIGGILGYGKGGLEIRYSNNFGDVTGTEQVGGIVGVIEAVSDKDSKIEYVYNEGKLEGGSCVGGIVGTANNYSNIIKYAANHGDVNATRNNVGGIVGRQWSYTAGLSLDYTYNTGEITGKTYTGGLIGCTELDSEDKENAKIKNSYNIGTIKNRVGSKEYVGALIGRNYKDRASNSNLHFLSGMSTPNKAFGTGGGGGTNKSNGTATMHSNLAGIKGKLSGYPWVYRTEYIRLKGIKYDQNDNYSGFDTKIWVLDTSDKINSNMPYFKEFYW